MQKRGIGFGLKFKDGPFLYLDPSSSFEEQFERMLIIKEEKLKETFSSKQYIDLRYGESIYFR